ncbi:MAG: hypothetical protein QNL04_09470, partial [SAR324 cluster bacterium]|nr:hypothetical protein [SAR324 cluster bacterium]
ANATIQDKALQIILDYETKSWELVWCCEHQPDIEKLTSLLTSRHCAIKSPHLFTAELAKVIFTGFHSNNSIESGVELFCQVLTHHEGYKSNIFVIMDYFEEDDLSKIIQCAIYKNDITTIAVLGYLPKPESLHLKIADYLLLKLEAKDQLQAGNQSIALHILDKIHSKENSQLIDSRLIDTKSRFKTILKRLNLSSIPKVSQKLLFDKLSGLYLWLPWFHQKDYEIFWERLGEWENLDSVTNEDLPEIKLTLSDAIIKMGHEHEYSKRYWEDIYLLEEILPEFELEIPLEKDLVNSTDEPKLYKTSQELHKLAGKYRIDKSNYYNVQNQYQELQLLETLGFKINDDGKLGDQWGFDGKRFVKRLGPISTSYEGEYYDLNPIQHPSIF